MHNTGTPGPFLFLAIVAFIELLPLISIKAQASNYNFEHLTTEQGLSSDKVASIIQDREGFYWITTQNGLNRFDGTSFKIFRNNPADSTTLTHNSCGDILEGHNGDIWTATYSGISRFVKSKGAFKRILLKHPSYVSDLANRIFALEKDNDGNIWIAGYGLWKYNVRTDSLQLFLHDPDKPGSISDNSLITGLVFDKKNNGLWFATGDNVNFYSISAGQFYHSLHNPERWKIFDFAYPGQLALDSMNRLWCRDNRQPELIYFDVKTNQVNWSGKKLEYGVKQISIDGLNRVWVLYWLAGSEIFDPVSGKTDTDFFSKRHRKSILSEKAGNLFIDRENNYWITSSSGISIYHPENQYYKLRQLHIDEKGTEDEPIAIRGIAQTDSNHVWLATNVGLFDYNLKAETFQKINVDPPIKRISAFCADGNNLWIGYVNEILLFNTSARKVIKRYKLVENIFFVTKTEPDNVWAGIWRGGLYRINQHTNAITKYDTDSSSIHSLKTNSVISSLADGNRLWIGYNLGNGFSQYDPVTNIFLHFNPAGQFPTHPNAGTITAIGKDHTGTYWLGTHGSGAYQWNSETDTYVSLQQHNGLASNFINSIIPDRSNGVWISSSDGIDYYQVSKKNTQALNIQFVLPSTDHINNGLHGLNGNIYFFRQNEFVEIFPAAFNPDPGFSNLVVTSFKIFDKEVPLLHLNDNINLSYDENFFSFAFSAINPYPDKNVRYAYKLNGFDNDWIFSGTQNFASYTNVPGGRYTFEVKSTNAEGKWSDVMLSIPINITPPFWRTWWFTGLAALFILALFYIIHRYRIAHIKKIITMRTKISQDLHDDIGGSLSSINIYSSVAEKEVMDNPEKAKEFLQQINSSSRQVMDDISDIVWANNTARFNETSLAGRIKNYGYDLLSQKNIECEYVIDALVEKKLSSPEARRNVLLIIKEALNNMAKYSEATHAEIHIAVNGSDLLITIFDNGRGFMISEGRAGNGISGMKRRTQMMGGHFQISSTPGIGTRVSCEIPLARISD